MTEVIKAARLNPLFNLKLHSLLLKVIQHTQKSLDFCFITKKLLNLSQGCTRFKSR